MFADNDLKHISAAGVTLVRAAAAKNNEKCVLVFEEIVDTYGVQGAFLLCSGMAAAVIRLGGLPTIPGAFHGFQVLDPETGRTISSDSIEDPNGRIVVRTIQFLMAHLNEDHDQMQALFLADPTNLAAGLTALVAAVARDPESLNQMLRHRCWRCRLAILALRALAFARRALRKLGLVRR